MKEPLRVLLFMLFFGQLSSSFAQHSLSVTVKVLGEPAIGVYLSIPEISQYAITDVGGTYNFTDIPEGTYTIKADFLGHYAPPTKFTVKANQSNYLTINMSSDAMELNQEIETGLSNQSKLESSMGISSLNSDNIQFRNLHSAGEVLMNVSGTYVDNSGGDAGTRIFARGLASGARSQPGYHYISLQEDGLPVSSTQLFFGLVDLYHRIDASVERFEAIRGGSSVVFASNSPGGIANFISKEGQAYFEGFISTRLGLQGDNRKITRTDFNVGGPFRNSDWRYNIGGFYRWDEGPRNVPYTANEGGQLKVNVTKETETQYWKIYGKLLDDKVTYYQDVPVMRRDEGNVWYNMDNFKMTEDTYFLDVFSDNLPDVFNLKNDNNATTNFDIKEGSQVKNYAIGFETKQKFSEEWELKNKFKYAHTAVNSNENQIMMVIPVETGPGLLYNLDSTSINQFVYIDAETEDTLYDSQRGINMIGKYLHVPKPTIVNGKSNDFQNELSFSRTSSQHKLTFGSYLSYFSNTTTYSSNAVLSTSGTHGERRLLRAYHANPYAADDPDNPTLTFTDRSGFIGYGNYGYLNFDAQTSNITFFLNDIWAINDRLNLDIGLRYEMIRHRGEKEDFSFPMNSTVINTPNGPVSMLTGLDGDYTTVYDRATRFGNGNYREFDHNYNFLAYSVGINYKMSEKSAVYARITQGYKAPDLAFYQNSFLNIDAEKGEIEENFQTEIGYKLRSDKVSLFLTGFYSHLDNVPFQLFVTGAGTTSRSTEITYNELRTFGAELEAIIQPTTQFNVRIAATLQDSKFNRFTYYNVSGSPSNLSPDDITEDFSGNVIPDIPSVLIDITPTYTTKDFTAYVNWRYIGTRYGNRRNHVLMPSINLLNAGVQVTIQEQFDLGLHISNLLDTQGALLYICAGILRGTPEDVDYSLLADFENRDQPLFIKPVLPQAITISMSYRF